MEHLCQTLQSGKVAISLLLPTPTKTDNSGLLPTTWAPLLSKCLQQEICEFCFTHLKTCKISLQFEAYRSPLLYISHIPFEQFFFLVSFYLGLNRLRSKCVLHRKINIFFFFNVRKKSMLKIIIKKNNQIVYFSLLRSLFKCRQW